MPDVIEKPVDLGTVIVTGGSGGLASHIIDLLQRLKCARLHSVDLLAPVNRQDHVTYHVADLTDAVALLRIFEAIRPDVVIHTASPKFDSPRDIMHRVNVQGTENVIQAAKASGAGCCVYTSSASVISDGRTDLINADETFPLVIGDRQPEFYVHTKALAEMYVLSQNRPPDVPNFLTCAIRPSGIFGVGDYTVLPGILEPFFQGRTKVQIGANRNLFDFTENTNVAYAHYLAAAALARHGNSEAVPVADDGERVDGEAFFVTNAEPRYFWDFTRLVWRLAGDQTRPDQIWTITRPWALLLAGALEWIFWALRLGESPLTRTKVRLSCMTRYFCIDKAEKRLGYRPLVGLEDGLRRGVQDCLARRAAQRTDAKL